MATAERKTGLGTLPAGLLRPTTPPPPPEADDEPDPDDEAGAAEDQGRGDAPKPRARRRRRPPVTGEAKGRKIHLPDEIHDRLRLLAFQRRTTISAVATDILDKNLPRLRVERDG
jgi:hypothetical protein